MSLDNCLDNEYIFKIVFIGYSEVGKSNIIYRYVNDIFIEDSKHTVGVELETKFVVTNRIQKIKLQIWDTAGLTRYISITSYYYKSAHCIFVVYDITNKSSFENVDKWFENAKKNCAEAINILIGNKADDKNNREISLEEGREKAK